jgi:hypothetical protein
MKIRRNWLQFFSHLDKASYLIFERIVIILHLIITKIRFGGGTYEIQKTNKVNNYILGIHRRGEESPNVSN